MHVQPSPNHAGADGLKNSSIGAQLRTRKHCRVGEESVKSIGKTRESSIVRPPAVPTPLHVVCERIMQD
jgi:hypothetical protein